MDFAPLRVLPQSGGQGPAARFRATLTASSFENRYLAVRTRGSSLSAGANSANLHRFPSSQGLLRHEHATLIGILLQNEAGALSRVPVCSRVAA